MPTGGCQGGNVSRVHPVLSPLPHFIAMCRFLYKYRPWLDLKLYWLLLLTVGAVIVLAYAVLTCLPERKLCFKRFCVMTMTLSFMAHCLERCHCTSWSLSKCLSLKITATWHTIIDHSCKKWVEMIDFLICFVWDWSHVGFILEEVEAFGKIPLCSCFFFH